MAKKGSLRRLNPIARKPLAEVSGRENVDLHQRQALDSSTPAKHSSWLQVLPEKAKRQLSRGEQDCVSCNPELALERGDVDRSGQDESKSQSVPASHGDVQGSAMPDDHRSSGTSRASKAFLENFKWLDEDQDLDLHLLLDNYHANLSDAVLPQPNTVHPQRPSFRRDPSLTLSGSEAPPPLRPKNPARQHASAKIAMTPDKSAERLATSSPTERSAMYYRDPDAREKLRVYLASPQKFDEAIEFGFPAGSDEPMQDNVSRVLYAEAKSQASNDRMNTSFFLDDDQSIISQATLPDDETSHSDSNMPRTPENDSGYGGRVSFDPETSPAFGTDGRVEYKILTTAAKEYSHLGISRPRIYRPAADPETPASGSLSPQDANREMTIRMTLTKPGLRDDKDVTEALRLLDAATEDQLRSNATGSVRRKTRIGGTASAKRGESRCTTAPHTIGPFGGVDGWGEAETGLARKLWHRVSKLGRR
jgi:hypothetical protein